jgi:glc operon protein GlcG
MASFKGRYSEKPFAESLMPPLPPPIEVLEEDDFLLSPIVKFATGGTPSIATEATANSSITSTPNNSGSANNSTTSTISDDDNDYTIDLHEDITNGRNRKNNNRDADNDEYTIGTSQRRSNGKGSGGRRNPFGAMRRRLGGSKNKAGTDEESLYTKERLAAAVSAALDGNQDEENSAENQLVEVKLKGNKPMGMAPINYYGNNTSPVAAAFQSSAIVVTQAVADIGMAAAEAEAEANGWDVTICICDTAGIPIQVKRNTVMVGTAASYEMAVGKAKMASMFGKATGGGKAAGEEKELALTTVLASVYPFLQLGGGVPLILNGSCCGAVGVSSGGLISRSDLEQDEQVAWAAVKAMADIYWSYKVLAADEV